MQAQCFIGEVEAEVRSEVGAEVGAEVARRLGRRLKSRCVLVFEINYDILDTHKP
jgi:hypothetical protein